MLDTSEFKISLGQDFKIDDLDPNTTRGNKAKAKTETRKLIGKLDELQENLYAEHKHKVLIVLQAMDTGGKDGVIRRIFEGVNPAGVRVAHFREPSEEEKDRGFLWRYSEQVPRIGEIVIFNRSQYEGVLVERVHKIVSEEVYEKRYDEINEFETLLAQEGTSIVKFYLHIDSEEQKKRILERIRDPTKEWKFSSDDLSERRLWPEYMKAYEEVLTKTSTAEAPWYAVPANHRWFRDYLVATVVVELLESLKLRYPKLGRDLKSIKIE